MSKPVGEFLRVGAPWTPAEKAVVKWRFRLYGGFYTKLWDAIAHADDANLDRLAMGFPDEVAGFRMWQQGDLAGRLHAAGLEL